MSYNAIRRIGVLQRKIIIKVPRTGCNFADHNINIKSLPNGLKLCEPETNNNYYCCPPANIDGPFRNIDLNVVFTRVIHR